MKKSKAPKRGSGKSPPSRNPVRSTRARAGASAFEPDCADPTLAEILDRVFRLANKAAELDVPRHCAAGIEVLARVASELKRTMGSATNTGRQSDVARRHQGALRAMTRTASPPSEALLVDDALEEAARVGVLFDDLSRKEAIELGIEVPEGETRLRFRAEPTSGDDAEAVGLLRQRLAWRFPAINAVSEGELLVAIREFRKPRAVGKPRRGHELSTADTRAAAVRSLLSDRLGSVPAYDIDRQIRTERVKRDSRLARLVAPKKRA